MRTPFRLADEHQPGTGQPVRAGRRGWRIGPRVRLRAPLAVMLLLSGCAAPVPSPTSPPPAPKPTTAETKAAPKPTAAPAAKPAAAEAKPTAKPAPQEPTPVPGSVEALLADINRLPPGERTKRLEEGARKEGKAVVYGTIAFDEEEEFLSYFRKKYSYLQVEYVRGRTGELLQRVLTEMRARRLGADFLLFPAAEMYVMQQAGVFARYRSPELAGIREGFYDPKGSWTVRHTNPQVLAYNTKLVSAAEAPKRFEDLLDPKWKGKVGMPQPEGPRMIPTLEHIYGEARAMEMLRALAAQNPSWIDSNTSLAQALARGEVAVAAVLSSSVDTAKEEGGPVEYLFPDPLILQMAGIAIGQAAPHPHAAALLIDWQLSKEGQEINSKISPLIGGRTDVAYPNADILRARRLVVQTPEMVGTNYEKYSKLFAELFAR